MFEGCVRQLVLGSETVSAQALSLLVVSARWYVELF